MRNEFETIDGRQVWVAGEVVIEGVRHLVASGYVRCDPSLNHRAWNTTAEAARCPQCFNQSFNQQSDNMDFFKQLAEASPNLDLTLRLMRKGDTITIMVLPTTTTEIKPLQLTGTIDELDAEFFNHIRQPLQVANGITSNADEFVQAAAKVAPKAAAKPAAKAVDKQKPAEPAAPAEEKMDPPAEEAPPAARLYKKGDRVTFTSPGTMRGRAGRVENDQAEAGAPLDVIFDFERLPQKVDAKDVTVYTKAEDIQPAAAPAAPAPPRPMPPKPGAPTPALFPAS